MYTKNNTLLNLAILQVTNYLRQFAQQLDFPAQMQLVFGNQANIATIQDLGTSWQAGDIGIIPEIEVLPSVQLNGANGAYSQQTDTIYLSEAILNQQNADLIVRILLEEIGHRIDGLVNVADTPGDEGAMFLELVLSGGVNPYLVRI